MNKDKLKEKVSNTSKVTWTVGIIVVIILILLGIRLHRNGSLTTPKTQSFPEQLTKSQGEHIWFYTDNGKAKDSIIDYIDVTKNGKLTEYQIFDDNITLGKLSKMSNRQIIALAKKQDRKYFDDAPDEIKNAQKEVTYNGLMNDLAGKENKDFRTEIKYGVTNQKNFSTESAVIKDFLEVARLEKNDDTVYPTDDVINELRQRRIDAAIKNAKNAKYLAPKPQRVSIKTTTDDTGNKPVVQTIKYKTIDMFNEDSYDKTYLEAAQSDEKVKAFYNKYNDFLRQLNKQVDDDTWSEKTKNYQLEVEKKFVPSFNAAKSEVLNTFTPAYFEKATKGLVKPYTFETSVELTNPVSQQIYNKRFIGYQIGEGNSYLLTMAQNKDQKAVLNK